MGFFDRRDVCRLEDPNRLDESGSRWAVQYQRGPWEAESRRSKLTREIKWAADYADARGLESEQQIRVFPRSSAAKKSKHSFGLRAILGVQPRVVLAVPADPFARFARHDGSPGPVNFQG
jgi:hypothetical protein